MAYGTFSEDVRAKKRLLGTFVKTPEILVIETLARSGLDFICLDGEHAAFDRARLDNCIAVARALSFPCIVRIPAARPEYILQALDSGAAGLVIPHVDSAKKAAEMGRYARFGNGGRGFAGATRGSDWGIGGMSGVLDRGNDPVVIVQIEEPEGVEAAAGIAAAEGVDGVFVGPADLSVGYGHSDMQSDDLARAYTVVGDAASAATCAYATFAATVEATRALEAHGVHMFFVASDLAFMQAAANAATKAFRN